MLKTRIIPTLLCRGRELVKGKRFDSWRRVGNTLQAAKVHGARGVDELIILNADGLMSPRMVSDLCAGTFMPVAIGGGVRCLEHFAMLFENGADKVVINTGAIDNPDLITEAAAKYGSQAVVISIDAKDGRVVGACGSYPTDKDAVRWAHEVQCLGAGEILINDIDRDGTLEGYNIDLIAVVSKAVRIPVIAAGGCGTYRDMAAVLTETEASAVSAGAMFIFTDNTPRGAAEYLALSGFPVRLD